MLKLANGTKVIGIFNLAQKLVNFNLAQKTGEFQFGGKKLVIFNLAQKRPQWRLELQTTYRSVRDICIRYSLYCGVCL